MKHGNKLTRAMKELLSSKGYNPDDWLYIKNPHNELHIAHKRLGRVEIIERRENQ